MGFLGSLLDNAKSVKEVVSARRVPGKVYIYAFRLLDSLGVEKITIIDSKGLRVSGYTLQMWEYLIIKDKKEYDIVRQDFAPGMTVIDIGANQGFFTIHAASKGARVIAVEPSRTNLGLLKENVEQNNLANNVVCINCAVSDKIGKATMFETFSDRGRYLSTFVSIVDRDRGDVSVRESEVRVITLDELFASNGIEACDLLKMDCEGSEYAILSSTSPETFSRIKNISFEFHDGRIHELKSWLDHAGFEVISVRSTSGTGNRVGLMKARKNAAKSQPYS
jgi:FkbM family methyltransferase